MLTEDPKPPLSCQHTEDTSVQETTDFYGQRKSIKPTCLKMNDNHSPSFPAPTRVTSIPSCVISTEQWLGFTSDCGDGGKTQQPARASAPKKLSKVVGRRGISMCQSEKDDSKELVIKPTYPQTGKVTLHAFITITPSSEN